MNEYVFANLNVARQIIEQWRIDYNINRPHASLNGLTPIEFAKRTDEGKTRAAPGQRGSEHPPICGSSSHSGCRQLNLIDGMNVYPFDRSPRWIVHFRKLLRPAKRGRCRTCNRRSDGDGETGGRILEKAVKYCPVQISLF